MQRSREGGAIRGAMFGLPLGVAGWALLGGVVLLGGWVFGW